MANDIGKPSSLFVEGYLDIKIDEKQEVTVNFQDSKIWIDFHSLTEASQIFRKLPSFKYGAHLFHRLVSMLRFFDLTFEIRINQRILAKIDPVMSSVSWNLLYLNN